MALAFSTLELFGKGGEGMDITQMIIVDIDIQVVPVLSRRVMTDDHRSVFFEVAGGDAHLEAAIEEIELGRRQSGIIFGVFR